MTNRYAVLVIMVLAMIMGYMPWYNFSAVLKYITTELGLTAADTGQVLAAFQAGYVLVVPATGWLADKVGLKRVLLAATAATGISSALFALLADSKSSVMVLRMMTGLSAGAIYVPGMVLLSRWFPATERGSALGAYTGGLVAAYAGGYLLAAPLAAEFGWRTAVLWTSLPPLIAAGLIALWVRETPPTARQTGHHDLPGRRDEPDRRVNVHSATIPEVDPGLAKPGRKKGPAVISVAYMGHMWELYAFWGWIGPFLVAAAAASGMATGAAVVWGGNMAAAIILLGAPASWLWGIAADRIGRTAAIIVAASLSAFAELLLGYLFGLPLSIVSLAGAWIGVWVVADSAIYKVGITEMVPLAVRGTYLGLQSALGYAVTIVAPVAFGMVLEFSNGPIDPTSATSWGPAFMALGLGALLAPAAALGLRRIPDARMMAGGKM